MKYLDFEGLKKVFNIVDNKLSDYKEELINLYLPISGGTINNTAGKSAPLIIKTNNPNICASSYWIADSPKSYVGYTSTLGSVLFNYASQKGIGVKDDGTPHYEGNELWHKGNFTPSDYFPADGRKLTFAVENGKRAEVYATDEYGTYIQYGSDWIAVKDGNVYFKNSKVWHEGNDGSNSGLDADLLDGKQPADLNVGSANKLTENVLTNENLNTIKPDFFTNYIAQASNTCANKPSGVTGFNLTAYKTSNNFYIQILSSVIDGDYRRTCTNNTWSAWRKLSYEPNTISLKTTLETLVSTVETSGLYQLMLDEDSLITEGLKKSVVGDKVIFTDYITDSDKKLIFTIDNKKTISGYDHYIIRGNTESMNGISPIEGVMAIHDTQVIINLCSPLIIAWQI